MKINPWRVAKNVIVVIPAAVVTAALLGAAIFLTHWLFVLGCVAFVALIFGYDILIDWLAVKANRWDWMNRR